MKVAIVGTGGADMGQVPFGEPDWEIWGLNDLYTILPENVHVHRWFELHADTPLTRARRPQDHWERLAGLGIPVYTFYAQPSIPTAVRFPLDDVLRLRQPPYFACTMAYQIAYALLLGATTIALNGMPLVGAREALVEAKCVDWWLGYASGRGVEVINEHPYTCGVGKHPYLYAWQDQLERRFSYDVVRAHHSWVAAWLQSEEERLGLAQVEPVSLAKLEGAIRSWRRLWR